MLKTQLILADIHTNTAREKILSSLNEDTVQYVDFILINGDVIGEFSINKNTQAQFLREYTGIAEQILELKRIIDTGKKLSNDEFERLGSLSNEFLEKRYNAALDFIKRLSLLGKTVIFNYGVQESPLHKMPFYELVNFSGIAEDLIEYSLEFVEKKNHFLNFIKSVEKMEGVINMSGEIVEMDETLLVGIPALYKEYNINESNGKLQSQLVEGLIDEVKIKLHAKKYSAMYIFHNSAISSVNGMNFGELKGSEVLKQFVKELSTMDMKTVFINSYHHNNEVHLIRYNNLYWLTTPPAFYGLIGELYVRNDLLKYEVINLDTNVVTRVEEKELDLL